MFHDDDEYSRIQTQNLGCMLRINIDKVMLVDLLAPEMLFFSSQLSPHPHPDISDFLFSLVLGRLVGSKRPSLASGQDFWWWACRYWDHPCHTKIKFNSNWKITENMFSFLIKIKIGEPSSLMCQTIFFGRGQFPFFSRFSISSPSLTIFLAALCLWSCKRQSRLLIAIDQVTAHVCEAFSLQIW